MNNRKAVQAKYREAHKENILESHREYNKKTKNDPRFFSWYIWNRYKITLEQYDTIWALQRGFCAIEGCDWKLDSSNRRPHIDHNHECCKGNKSCGRCVRGLLCQRHNMALGNVRDSIDELQALQKYLKEGA